MKYNPSHGGHAPGHLRDEFENLVQAAPHEGPALTPRLADLCGKLWNCTDIMPSELCDALTLPPGSTYAQGARNLKRTGE